MDTLTHALTGALAGRALAGSRARVSPAAAGWTGALAAVFPDSDFAIALIDPYAYLTLHRAFTHSLVLLPLWALLVAATAALLSRGRYRWRDLLPFAAAGLAVHIAGDLFNIWDMKIAWPLTDAGISLPVLFIIDPWYSALVIAGLLLSLRWRVRAGALAGLALVAAYTAIQFPLHAYAERLAAAQDDTPPGRIGIYAQPFSPLNRRVVVSDDAGHSWAYLRVHGRGLLSRSYLPPGELDWRRVPRPEAADGFPAEAWHRDEMEGFREFAGLPYLYSRESDAGQDCAWFADLQFMAPGRTPPFRWGMCRHPDGSWSRHRLGRW